MTAMVPGRNLRLLAKMGFLVDNRSEVRYSDILVIDAKTYVAEATLATEVVLHHRRRPRQGPVDGRRRVSIPRRRSTVGRADKPLGHLMGRPCISTRTTKPMSPPMVIWAVAEPECCPIFDFYHRSVGT
jgi:hypothetical protein